MKVVLVENVPKLRQRLLALMSSLPGVEVTAATGSVAEAIRAVRESHPDIVVLDLRLSDGSGFEVMREIKSDSKGPAVMMLTLFPSESTRRYFFALGGEFFFDKSSQLDEAIALLASLTHRNGIGGGYPDEAPVKH